MNKLIYYIGDGPYCYASSTAMLLAYIGENISPSIIEVLTGVSLGATLEKKRNLLWFNNQTLLPDLGLTKALDILGFTYKTKVFDSPRDFPLKELKKDLIESPAVLGPLDMGYLAYNPRYKYHKGFDHFVFAYRISKKGIFLHDPAGFPHVFLPISELKQAWQAKGISYKKGCYRYTCSPQRIKKPTDDGVYADAISFFKLIYKEGLKKTKFGIGSKAIAKYAKYIRNEGLNENEWGHFVYFTLPLGSRRALDYAKFFKPYDQKLGRLKYQQAEVFGICHTYAASKKWGLLADNFEKLAETEEAFKMDLLALK